MSKVQRKEYQETKIVKTLSPVRGTRGSSQNLAEFDNNLDYLLEDLQSSVTGPTSNTLGSTGRSRVISNVDSGRSNSLNRVTHLKASNPVTEYSSDDSYNYTSPDGSKSVKSFKKESYSYSSSADNVAPEKLRMQNNINQLDSLLDDLKQVKQGSSINNTGTDPGLLETSKSRVMMGKKVVERDIYYGDTPPRPGSRSEREGSVSRELQYIDEGTYGETRPIRYRTPSPSQSQTSTLTKQKKVTNVHAYPMEVMETSTPDINPEILAHLDPNLLPSGNTKVTTTIKTYTYEIPGSGYKPAAISPDSEKYVYSPNQSQTTPSKSFVYSKVENSDVTNTVTYPPPSEQSWKANVYKETVTSNQSAPPYQRPAPPAGSDTTVIKETTTTRNYQPGYHPYPDPPLKQTYVYNETTTTKNVNEGYPDDSLGRPVRRSPVNREPPQNETYIYKETHNTTTNKTAAPYSNGYPPQEPGSTTVIYKHDTHTSNYGAPPRRQTPPNTTVLINKSETNTTENYDPNRYPGRPGDSPRSRRPNEPYDPNNVNITYKYTTHSSTSNNYKGYPPGEESQPLLRPQPFPSDGEIDGPPKRVDELMAKIGNEPPDSPLNSGFTAHEAELIHQKKVDTLKQKQESNELQKKEKNHPPTKNITGPPVYYPPGHELFAKKEESGAWRAEGAMAKESGKYKYEAESSSKSKSRSGAAIVPVCLPLCCGIPCTLL